MTTELTKAAQQALEALKNVTDYDQINAARRALQSALTQRPAAQTEREAFESAALAKWGQLDFKRSEVEPEMYYNQRLDDAWIGFGFAVAWLRASLPAPKQATPEPLTGCNCRWQGETQVEWCGLHLAHKEAIHEWAERAKAAEAKLAATPDPVGEPVAQVSDLFPSVRNKLHAQGFDSDAPLFTRPAPGVPEGFALVPMTEDQVWHNDSIMSANAIGGLKMDAVMRIVRGVEAHHSERLAAAQAKGAGHE